MKTTTHTLALILTAAAMTAAAAPDDTPPAAPALPAPPALEAPPAPPAPAAVPAKAKLRSGPALAGAGAAAASSEDSKRANEEVKKANEEIKRAQQEVERAMEKAEAAGQIGHEQARQVTEQARQALEKARQAVEQTKQWTKGFDFNPLVQLADAWDGGNSFEKGFSFASSGGHGGSTLIVTGQAPTPQTRGALEEDLGIMRRILEKKISRDGGPDSPDRAMGINITIFDGEGGGVRAEYLEGYGVLFTTGVRMPLLPPAKSQEPKSKAAADSVWEETRNEIYGNRGESGSNSRFRVEHRDKRSVEYDANKVEALKKSLLEALKNATHIRDLKPQEYVTVAVTGQSGSSSGIAITSSTTPGLSGYHPAVMAKSSSGSGGGSTLVIRVKKSDVDAFATDKMSFEEFQKAAAVSVY